MDGGVLKPRLKPSAAALFGTGPRADAFVGPGATSRHAAASYSDPALSGWYPPNQSADADLLAELPLMAGRVTDEERNNGLVHSAKLVYQDNLVGHQLRVNPAPVLPLLGWTPEQGENWSRLTRAHFESWANVPNEVDAARELNLRGLTIQAIGTWFLSGNAIAIPIWRPREAARWNTRLHLIDPNRIGNPPFFQSSTRSMRGGWEVDRDGAKVALWGLKTAPGDEQFAPMAEVSDPNKWFRIPAFYPWGRRRVIHLYDKERSGQSMGKPIVARIIRELRMLSHYSRVELQATISNSLVAAVLESQLDPETAHALFNSGGENGESYWDRVTSEFRARTRLKAGATLTLPPGAKFSGFTPNRPNNAFDQFTQALLHHIGAGLGLPAEWLTKDFTRANYSVIRAAALEAWRRFMTMRAWIEEMWLDPIYELFLEEAVNDEAISAPDFYQNRFAYSWTRNWSMVGRGWVDEAKEALGAKLRIDAGVSSVQAECEKQGVDWMEMLEDKKRLQDYAEELGVELAPAAPAASQSTSPKADLAAENADQQDQDQQDQQERKDARQGQPQQQSSAMRPRPMLLEAATQAAITAAFAGDNEL